MPTIELPKESRNRTVYITLKDFQNYPKKSVITKFYDGLFHFNGLESELPGWYQPLLRDWEYPKGVEIIKKTFSPEEVSSWFYPEMRFEYIENKE